MRRGRRTAAQESSIASEQLNGRGPEIVRTYISQQIYESAFLPREGRGRNIYNVSPSTLHFSFSSLPILKRIAVIFWCEIYIVLRCVSPASDICMECSPVAVQILKTSSNYCMVLYIKKLMEFDNLVLRPWPPIVLMPSFWNVRYGIYKLL